MTDERTCANCVNYLTEDDSIKRLKAAVEMEDFMCAAAKEHERREWRKTLGLGCVALIFLLTFTALALVGVIVL